MTPSGFILVVGCFSCVMQIKGISGQTIVLYHTPEQDVTLPCKSAPMCFRADWLYHEDSSSSMQVVKNGNVVQSSAQASRIRVNFDCSLSIRNVSEEDAGLYTCLGHTWMDVDRSQIAVHLNILTVDPFIPGSNRGGIITLECSLWRFVDNSPCPRNNLRWVDETGSVLKDEYSKYKLLLQRKCTCVLKVNQSHRNRRYTCQFVDENNNTLISAEYTPVFTSDKQDDQTKNSAADCAVWTPLSCFMLALRIIEVFMITVVTVLLIRNTVRRTS
ncbi:uncharacterized protein LOC115433562 [Sphaeramia orbicularis]|uniref:uncharacterized protein LOC115433562 n=1 Tax=Sphaeramia orbicularis TaxID=375764 RepID=UPI00117DA51C|nr:uncharacterized protein LOC115433562 [Sphaeramia orbicularis]